MTLRVGLIWAQADGGVIGAGGAMPWHVPEDLAHFKAVTADRPVVMGRRTWDSLPARFRPLPGRRNIVITRRPEWEAPGAERAASLEQALERLDGRVWVIGGGEIFRQAIEDADRLEITQLDLQTPGDAFAPEWTDWTVIEAQPAAGWETSRTGIRYRFLTCTRDAALQEPALQKPAP
jgi:dihydrofolate reductase